MGAYFRNSTDLGIKPEIVICHQFLLSNFLEGFESHIQPDFVSEFKTICNCFCKAIDMHFNPFKIHLRYA